jgi:hypothetical protein
MLGWLRAPQYRATAEDGANIMKKQSGPLLLSGGAKRIPTITSAPPALLRRRGLFSSRLS